MKNILFIMNVDWYWIKQRPHFIAEGLSKLYKVKIIYQFHYNRKHFQKNRLKCDNVSVMYLIPRIDRYPILMNINVFLRRMYYRYHIQKNKSNILYLTYPTQIESVPKSYEGKIIYDCMDDHAMFFADGAFKNRLIKAERALCEKANQIICTSLHLENVLKMRYGEALAERLVLVRNGFSGPYLDVSSSVENKEKDIFEIYYFGTISKWFDFSMLMRSLEDFGCIKYVLYGPAEISIPTNERIEYRGTVEHEELYDACKDADAFIMPFVKNEIVESVDPVKLYEYINLAKPVISIEYQEIKRFEPFVYMYDNYSEYKDTLNKLIQNGTPKFTNLERVNFLGENGWEQRIQSICSVIEKEEQPS